jgi:hypothetical protein
MSGFVKLNCDILDSSIMLEDSDTFKAFIVFLASCNSEGIACVPTASIVMRCRVSIDRAFEILARLMAPDPASKSKEEQGRRIVPHGDSGYHYRVVNYKKYREFTYSDNPEAVKKRKQRGYGEFRDVPGTVPENDPDQGPVPTSLSSVLLSSVPSLNSGITKKKTKKEIHIPKIQVHDQTPVDDLFQFWLSHKNMVQHKELSETVRNKIKATLKETAIEDLKSAIEAYDKILGLPGYLYTYKHSMEDFFRAGANKPSPYKKFLPEMNPLENLKLKGRSYTENSQQEQEQAETSSRVEQERFTEDRALNRLSEAVRRFKIKQGEDPKKWVDFFCFARPADRNNAFLRWIWDMAIKGTPFNEEIFNQIHNRIVAESGLTYDTFEQSRDAIFNRGPAITA